MKNCEVLPPSAEVKPTETPPTDTPADKTPKFCNFETDLCSWYEESGLNSTESFVWMRTSGEEQDGLTGPQQDYDHTESSQEFYILLR